jgi:hypothetical protein
MVSLKESGRISCTAALRAVKPPGGGVLVSKPRAARFIFQTPVRLFSINSLTDNEAGNGPGRGQIKKPPLLWHWSKRLDCEQTRGAWRRMRQRHRQSRRGGE